MPTHLTEKQERIAVVALERGYRVWRDDVTGEFGPTVDVRIGEVGAVGNGSTITFWRDGSVTVSTTSRNFHEHSAMAQRAQAIVAELLIAATREAAKQLAAVKAELDALKALAEPSPLIEAVKAVTP